MKKNRLCWNCLRAALARIHLVDKCLLAFMVVLLMQSTYSLFFGGNINSELNNIDIIVRTSSAAIFGYFLSVNFIRHSAESTPPPKNASVSAEKQEKPASTGEEKPRAQIGFVPTEPREEPERGKAEIVPAEAPIQTETAGRLQIIVAAIIGLFCLLALIFLRNVSQWNTALVESPSVTATVAQFRDFVSGCVGFLIGCPTGGTGQTKP